MNTLVRVLNWNLDAYNFSPRRSAAIFEMIKSHLRSGLGEQACVVILTEVPKSLLHDEPGSLNKELERCGLHVYLHRPHDSGRRHGVVVALSTHFSSANVVRVSAGVSALVDNLVLETSLDGVGTGTVFAVRPLVWSNQKSTDYQKRVDYQKRADGLFGFIEEVIPTTGTGANPGDPAFILGAGDFNHAKIYGVGNEAWQDSEKLYVRKLQEPIAYQKIRSVFGRRGLRLVTPRSEDGRNFDTSIGEFSFDHTVVPSPWSLVSSRYFERCDADSSEHKLQVSEFSDAR